MTWILKTRGSPSSLTVAEYECPMHGRFELTVGRDANGDPPSNYPCPMDCEDSNFPLEESVPCDLDSPWVISAPLGHVPVASVSLGKVSKSERSTWTDTEALADRGAWSDWKKKRKAVWEEHRYKKNVADGRKGT